MGCNPQSASVIGNAAGSIGYRKSIHNPGTVHHISRVALCHKLYKVIGQPLNGLIIGITNPYILTVKSNAAQMAFGIHSQGNQKLSCLLIKHKKLPHTGIFLGVRGYEIIIIRYENPLWYLGLTINKLIQPLIILGGRHTGNLHLVHKIILQILQTSGILLRFHRRHIRIIFYIKYIINIIIPFCIKHNHIRITRLKAVCPYGKIRIQIPSLKFISITIRCVQLLQLAPFRDDFRIQPVISPSSKGIDYIGSLPIHSKSIRRGICLYGSDIDTNKKYHPYETEKMNQLNKTTSTTHQFL